MTQIGDVLNRIARECSLSLPSSWVTATTLDYVEIRDDFLPQTIEEIQDRKELIPPIGKTTTLAGTGSDTYALPADFKRLARDPYAIFEAAVPTRTPYRTVSDGEFESLQTLEGAYAYARLIGYPGAYSLQVFPELDTGADLRVSYVSTAWLTNGVLEYSTFTNVTHELMLPRRVVELGCIMRFRRRKGLEYADILAEYEGNLDRMDTDFRGRRTVVYARRANELGGVTPSPKAAIPVT